PDRGFAQRAEGVPIPEDRPALAGRNFCRSGLFCRRSPRSEPRRSSPRDNNTLRNASAPIEPLSARSVAIAICISILWGGNLISIRIGVDSVPPLWSAFWRMALGVVIVTSWALYRRMPLRLEKGEGWPLLILGALFTAQVGLLNSGTAMTSPAFG